MKQLTIFVLLLIVNCSSILQAKSNPKPVINSIEDFFQFENVEQLSDCIGAENVFTETAYYGDPNSGGKLYLVSQVNFGTPHQALLIWNREGNQLYEVQASAYFYDFKHKKIKFIPNKWKTRQGIHAGMHLSGLVAINWFPVTINIRHVKGDSAYGDLHIRLGWVKNKVKVPYFPQKLVYIYSLDLKRINEFFPASLEATLKSNHKVVKKWDPMLELVTVYREGLKPDH